MIGEYSQIITEPVANNCFSINTQVIVSKKKRKSIVQHKNTHIVGLAAILFV